MPNDATRQILDEVSALRRLSDVDSEARAFIQNNPGVFQNETALSEFALLMEEEGVLPRLNIKITADLPSGPLTREQLRQLAMDPSKDPLIRAFAALSDFQYSSLLNADGTFRLSDAIVKLTSLNSQFFCASLAKRLSSSVISNEDGTTSTLFSLLDNAGVTFGGTDGLVGTGNLDHVIDAVTQGDSVWINRLQQAGVTLEELQTWRRCFADPDYAILVGGNGGQFASLDTLKNAYDPSTGTVSVFDQTGARLSFLLDGTFRRQTADGAVTITDVDGTSATVLPGGAIQYNDANGILQKIAANNWIITFAPGDASGMRGLQASQLDSPDGTLTWRYDGQGWRLHDTAKLKAASSASEYDASVIGDPQIYMDLMNYLPEQTKDPAGIVFQSKDGSLRITYTADGAINEKLPGFELARNAADLSKEQVTLADGSSWKMQDGTFRHFDAAGNLISGERALSETPEFDSAHNALLLRYADNSTKLINFDGSMVRTLADGTIVAVSRDGKPTSLTLQGNEYLLDRNGALSKIVMADRSQWIRSNDAWLHVDVTGSALEDSASGPDIPFQLNHGVFLVSSGNPPVLNEVIHPNGESTAFNYRQTGVPGSGALELTGVVDSSGRRMQLQDDGSWHLLNADGTEAHFEAVRDFTVSVDGQGNVTALELMEDSIVHHRTFAIQFTADGRTIESQNGEVSRISYSDGSCQQFTWGGDGEGKTRFVSSFIDRSGQVWQQSSRNNGTASTLVTTDASGQRLGGEVGVDLAGNVTIMAVQAVDDLSIVIDGSQSVAESVMSDGRRVSFVNDKPQTVTFLDGTTYGIQPDQSFSTPEGVYYWDGSVWKTSDGSKQAAYIQLDVHGGISIASTQQTDSGTTLSIENYYPNGDSLRTTSYLSIDTTTARRIAQSIKDDSSKLLPELTTLSVADRLAVDDQYFLLTGQKSHLVDIAANWGDVDKATVQGLLYITGERENGRLRNNIIELMQIAANAGGDQVAQNIAQQQIVYLLGSSTAAQIRQYETEFRDRYGYDFISAISNAPGISDGFRQALPLLSQGIDALKSGSQNDAYLNDGAFNTLKYIALKHNDLQLFSIAFQYASPEQRAAYRDDPNGLPVLSQHFAGDEFADATGYATVGAISLHRLVTKNTGLLYTDKNRILTDLAMNITDEERQMYKLGKEIALLNNFDLANPGVNKDLADEVSAFLAKYPDKSVRDITSFYATTFEDLKGAAWVWPFAQDPICWSQIAQYEAYLINGGPTGGNTTAVFDANPDLSDPVSIQRILNHLYNMPLTEMQMLRSSPDYAGAVRRDINMLPLDSRQLAEIMIDHIVTMNAGDFNSLTNGLPVLAPNLDSNSSLTHQPKTITPPFTPSQQLSFDTATGASDVQLAQDRLRVEQFNSLEQSIETLSSSDKSKVDLLTAILSLSQNDRAAILANMQNTNGQPVGQQSYAALLNRFSGEEQQVLFHALNRLKDEASPGIAGHLPLFDPAETMRLYTLHVLYVNDPGSIVNMLHVMDGADAAPGDKTAKIRMVLEYSQAFNRDVFADTLNAAGSEWKDRLVNALTIRPESWKDLANDATFKSMMSETGFAAFALWNSALQGMEAQRDQLLREVIAWETGASDDKKLQAELETFQASIASYVEAKRAYTMNALMVGLTIATLPLGAGLSFAGKLVLVGVSSLVELAGMKLGMGNDFDFSTEAVPDMLHGAANMSMLLLGGFAAERLTSKLIGGAVVKALDAVGIEAGAGFGGSLTGLVRTIESAAGDDAISAAATGMAVKILGENAAADAIRSTADLLIMSTTDALNGLSFAQRALINTAAMEGVGLFSHSLANIGTSLYENARSGKPIDMQLLEALRSAGENLLPTAAAILVGVGLSMITEFVTQSASTASESGSQRVRVLEYVQARITSWMQTLQEAGSQLNLEQRIALFQIRLKQLIDDFVNPGFPGNFAFAGGPDPFGAAPDSASSTKPNVYQSTSQVPGSDVNGAQPDGPPSAGAAANDSPSVASDDAPLLPGDDPPNFGRQPLPLDDLPVNGEPAAAVPTNAQTMQKIALQFGRTLAGGAFNYVGKPFLKTVGILGGATFVGVTLLSYALSRIQPGDSNSHASDNSDNQVNPYTGQLGPQPTRASYSSDGKTYFPPDVTREQIHSLLLAISSTNETYGARGANAARYITLDDLNRLVQLKTTYDANPADATAREQMQHIINAGFDPAVLLWLRDNFALVHSGYDQRFHGLDVTTEDTLFEYVTQSLY
ncbi:MAG: hypothetical protein EKK48_14040 [Candidatus Melainabacteria bacterium]|nr:MAG: hypothetical protein EKK48_14040 [Candidatus Melainabacteria bacterium]